MIRGMGRRRRSPALFIALLVTGAAALTSAPAAAQSGRTLDVTLSADTVEMGTLFELSVTVTVAPGSVAYFPDTLPATLNMESAAPVRTEAVGSPDGGALLTLTYPMMAFGVGPLPVPGFDILITPRGTQQIADTLPTGSAIGVWRDAPLRTDPGALTRVPRQAVQVTPVFTAEDYAEGLEPMPVNDVVGGSWSWPSLALILVCASVFVLTSASTTKEWFARGHGTPPVAPPSLDGLRERALRRLDDLFAEGLHTEDRPLEFYTSCSGIVRDYVEAMDAGWRSSLTSTELMMRLQRRWPQDIGSLPDRMAAAEVVKFGRLRPEAAAAERHWRVLRDWVEQSGGWAR